ncbi:DUF4983 domain-containing protein [Mucilaginibacter sp. dw_454]|uniref:DUF4983 domain-containing protein n=1 Tax=Mucilaginibacter sp. dw_454 TaxID=2720079 RepID=UPI001BD2FAC8|nr:DUF4983 domain-containing protein [Mucilaginibacter sp. dw_454]
MKNFKAKLLGVSLFVLTLAVVSCNHNFDKVVPPSPPFGQGVVYKTPKVLYIIADGARGTSVRDANIPNLNSLTPNAIYSWNSLADTNQVDATNWADMITGVLPAKHNVLSENFAGNALATYQPIFARIKSVRPNFRSVALSTSAAFKANLTTGADDSELFTGDDALTTAAANLIKTDTAQMVVAQFSDIEAAGKAAGSGFDNKYAPYKAAIEKFDTQVGTILTALKSRTTYSSENWMIIVTSNRGGAFTLPAGQDDKTIFSNTSANTFTIIYAQTFNPTFIAKPFVGNSYSGNSVEFLGDPQQGVAQADQLKSQAFNFADSSYSIEVKVKKHKNPVNVSRGDYYYTWPGFMGKKKDNGSGNPSTGWGGNNNSPGWDFCLFQNRWRFMPVGINSVANGEEIAGLEFTGDTWHDLLAVMERRPDGTTLARLYTDGVPGICNKGSYSQTNPLTTGWTVQNDPNQGNASGNPAPSSDINGDNNSILRLGYTPGEMDGGTTPSTFGKIDVDLKELKIFRAALPENVAKQYACDQSIDVSHPYFAYLIGYWPMDEGTGTTIHDKGPIGADFTLSAQQAGGYKWNQFTNDLICSPAATNLSLLVPKNADLPTQILSWFNIPRQSSWALDGKVWISN